MIARANVLKTDQTLPFRADVSTAISMRVRLLNITAVIVPFLGFVAVVVSLWGQGFHWVDLSLLLGMYAVTTMGITGYLPTGPLKPIGWSSFFWQSSARWPSRARS